MLSCRGLLVSIPTIISVSFQHSNKRRGFCSISFFQSLPRKITKDDCRQPNTPHANDVLNGASRHAGIDHALSIAVRASVSTSIRIGLRSHFVFLQDVFHPRSACCPMWVIRITFCVTITTRAEHTRPAKPRSYMG